jgi:hypothetical protein
MECDFATALPYNLDFKTDELDHLPYTPRVPMQGRMKMDSY